MINLKENQLIAMLEIAKSNPGVDIWDLMGVAGIEIEHEDEAHIEIHEIGVEELMGQHILNLVSAVNIETDGTGDAHFEPEEMGINDLIEHLKSSSK